MLKLGVNIDHVATLRQARGTMYPDLLEAARLCESAGAHCITVHLREDRRHVQDADVFALRKNIATRLNLEMADNPDIVEIARRVRPDEVCLVPERRAERTTEGGLNAAALARSLVPTIRALNEKGILVSLFVKADIRQIKVASEVGAACVELHTGGLCEVRGKAADAELRRLVDGAKRARDLGLKVNAGHGINLDNIRRILEIPYLDALNIGHSIIARSIFVGIKRAVGEMLVIMREYTGGRT